MFLGCIFSSFDCVYADQIVARSSNSSIATTPGMRAGCCVMCESWRKQGRHGLFGLQRQVWRVCLERSMSARGSHMEVSHLPTLLEIHEKLLSKCVQNGILRKGLQFQTILRNLVLCGLSRRTIFLRSKR